VIGLALAMEKFAALFFRNGANSGGIVKLPAGMDPEKVEAFKRSWKRENSGQQNAFKTALFADGMDFIKTASDPRNSQMIDTRSFQVKDIARLFRVPLHMIGDLSGATFSNIEQQSIDFVNNCLRPWATKDEQELGRKLLLEREKGVLKLRYNFKELLRGDTTARYAAYNTGFMGGWLLRNEIRQEEGLPPIPGGDVPLQPLNMGPSNGQTNNPPNPAPAPAPKPADPVKEEEEDEEEEPNGT
jgi:HK97 family phage portal protein